MTNIALILMLTLLGSLWLTGCVTPNLNQNTTRPTFTTAPSQGMTIAQVQQQWGPPWQSSNYVDSSGVEYVTYQYRERKTVILPSWGGGRPTRRHDIDWHIVHFRGGVVVGTSW